MIDQISKTTVTSHEPTNSEIRRAKLAAGIGNFITWFDFGAYGYLALVIAQVFFPEGNPTASLLATFGAFAAAFIMQPIGGMLFGHLGDRIGRRKVLVTVIIGMSGATFIIGVLPGYAQIGVTAAFLLFALRIVQGIFAGGEPGGAATFLVETARPGQRATTVSFWHGSSFLANAAASALVLSLHAMLDAQAMLDWGWRVPFLIAGPLGVVALIIRMTLPETAEFERLQTEGQVSERPLREAFQRSWKQIIQVFGAISLQAAAFYFVFIYMETYIQTELGRTPIEASQSTITTLLLAIVALVVVAKISDRIGRKAIMLTSATLLALLSYPIFIFMGSGSMITIILCHVLMGALLASFMGAAGAGLLEIFPSKIRYSGFSFGFILSVTIFGGTAPYIATALIAGTGSSLSPSFVVIVTAALAAISVATIKWPVHPQQPLDRAQEEWHHEEPRTKASVSR